MVWALAETAPKTGTIVKATAKAAAPTGEEERFIAGIAFYFLIKISY